MLVLVFSIMVRDVQIKTLRKDTQPLSAYDLVHPATYSAASPSPLIDMCCEFGGNQLNSFLSTAAK